MSRRSGSTAMSVVSSDRQPSMVSIGSGRSSTSTRPASGGLGTPESDTPRSLMPTYSIVRNVIHATTVHASVHGSIHSAMSAAITAALRNSVVPETAAPAEHPDVQAPASPAGTNSVNQDSISKRWRTTPSYVYPARSARGRKPAPTWGAEEDQGSGSSSGHLADDPGAPPGSTDFACYREIPRSRPVSSLPPGWNMGNAEPHAIEFPPFGTVDDMENESDELGNFLPYVLANDDPRWAINETEQDRPHSNRIPYPDVDAAQIPLPESPRGFRAHSSLTDDDCTVLSHREPAPPVRPLPLATFGWEGDAFSDGSDASDTWDQDFLGAVSESDAPAHASAGDLGAVGASAMDSEMARATAVQGATDNSSAAADYVSAITPAAAEPFVSRSSTDGTTAADPTASFGNRAIGRRADAGSVGGELRGNSTGGVVPDCERGGEAAGATSEAPGDILERDAEASCTGVAPPVEPPRAGGVWI